MANMRVVLDTNAYTAFMKGESLIKEILEEAEDIFLPAVVLGELSAGFYAGKHIDRNNRELDLFLSKPGVHCMDITRSIADRYGALVRDLKAVGNPIPTKDIWIAATVLASGAKLLTRDRHFEAVPGILVVSF
jgi:predicted nucleic acid-binding protein